jgi:hypothetical protein
MSDASVWRSKALSWTTRFAISSADSSPGSTINLDRETYCSGRAKEMAAATIVPRIEKMAIVLTELHSSAGL